MGGGEGSERRGVIVVALTGGEALPRRAATSPHLIIFHLVYGCAAPPVAAASVPGPVSLGRLDESPNREGAGAGAGGTKDR